MNKYPTITKDSTPAEKAVHLLRKSGRRIDEVAHSEYGSQLLIDIGRVLHQEAARILREDKGVQLGLPDIAHG